MIKNRIPKLKAYILKLDWIVDVIEIDMSIESVTVTMPFTNEESIYDFDEVILMNYTKAKDMNGVKIYEDDIVTIHYSKPYEAKDYVVSVDKNGVCLTTVDNTEVTRLTNMKLTVTEVIGNVNIKDKANLNLKNNSNNFMQECLRCKDRSRCLVDCEHLYQIGE